MAYEFKNYHHFDVDTLKLIIDEGKRRADDLIFVQTNTNTKSMNLVLVTLTYIAYIVTLEFNFTLTLAFVLSLISLFMGLKIFWGYKGAFKAELPSTFLTEEINNYDKEHVNKATMFNIIESYEEICKSISSTNCNRSFMLKLQVIFALLSLLFYIVTIFCPLPC